MKLPSNQKNRVRIWRVINSVCVSLMRMALIAGFSLAISSKATVPITELPVFGDLGNFTLFGGSINLQNVTVTGDVGVANGGSINRMAPGAIKGNLYLGVGATQMATAGPVNSIISNTNLFLQQDTVYSASLAMAGFMPDITYDTSPSSPVNISTTAGLITVVNLNAGLNQPVTVTGGGVAVLNILGGSVTLQGGVSGNPANIFINYTGTGSVSWMAGGGPVINAQIFVPNGTASTSGGTLNGSIFGGLGTMAFTSATVINGVAPVPEPGTTVLIMAGLVAFTLSARTVYRKPEFS